MANIGKTMEGNSTAVEKKDETSKALEAEARSTSLNLTSIIDGENERGIPCVKFVEDIGAFADSFTPSASAEILIGAFTDLFSKFKTYETSLSQKSTFCQSF